MPPRPLAPALCVLLAVVGVAPKSAQPSNRTYPLVSVQAATLERARESAARKLERPECQQILEEFRDARGRTLAENLAPWNCTPSEYLRMIPFLDGSSRPACRAGRAELFVVMGVPRVFVCPSFVQKQIREPWTAENMVIHEMLHTLGLGENPPVPSEITRRVNDRCQ
jgi:hypothetical protein